MQKLPGERCFARAIGSSDDVEVFGVHYFQVVDVIIFPFINDRRLAPNIELGVFRSLS